jgi:hypothetical protein
MIIYYYLFYIFALSITKQLISYFILNFTNQYS